MGAYITPEHLKFLEESKKAFSENIRLETYTNKEDSLIALRYGEDRDCISIFPLGEEIAFFAQQIEPSPTFRKVIFDFARDMESQLKVNDHKRGWDHTSESYLLGKIQYNLSTLDGKLSKDDRDKHEITIRCANIANYAMMIADNEGEHL